MTKKKLSLRNFMYTFVFLLDFFYRLTKAFLPALFFSFWARLYGLGWNGLVATIVAASAVGGVFYQFSLDSALKHYVNNLEDKN